MHILSIPNTTSINKYKNTPTNSTNSTNTTNINPIIT